MEGLKGETETGRQRKEAREKGPPNYYGNCIPYGLTIVLRGKIKNCFHCFLEILCMCT